MKKRVVRFLSIGVGLFVLILAVLALAFLVMNKTNGEIESSGQNRRYLLYVPESYDPNRATPLVISIHGFAEWPAHQMEMSHWNDLAEENGFIVVYPSGTKFPLRWGAHGGAGSSDDAWSSDVRFISDLIDALSSEYHIDPARIYANGLSNGGGMSHLLACKLSDRIAAIGTVAGAYLLPDDECVPSRPVPVIAFHGTADPIVPYEGAPSERWEGSFPAIPKWAEGWARRNDCDEDPVELPPTGAVSGVRYTECSQDAEVIFYTVKGGGHTWPGGEPLPEFIAGQTSQEIDATRLMWAFFEEHPLSE